MIQAAHPCLVQGLGKRVAMSQFRTQGRGGKGIRAIKLMPGDALAAVDTVSPPFLSEQLDVLGLESSQAQHYPLIRFGCITPAFCNAHAFIGSSAVVCQTPQHISVH